MINKNKIIIYRKIDYLYNQGALTLKGYNGILKELNLNESELNFINGGIII